MGNIFSFIALQFKSDNSVAVSWATGFFMVFRRPLVFSVCWVNYLSWSDLPLKWSGHSRRKSWVLWLFHLCKEQTMQSFFSSSVVLSFPCWETWYQNGYRLWCPLRLRMWDARSTKTSKIKTFAFLDGRLSNELKVFGLDTFWSLPYPKISFHASNKVLKQQLTVALRSCTF